jgi:hypothetical protein
MARLQDGDFKIFTLYIQGVNIDNIALEDIAAYLADFSELLGKDVSPRFHSIRRGSLKLGAKVKSERAIDVKTRGFLLRTGDAPEEAVRARERISRRLGLHHAKKATLLDPDQSKVIEIPIERPSGEFVDVPGLRRAGSLQGKVIRVGGTRDTVTVDLQDADGHVYPCKAKRDVAKKLARKIFEQTFRVFGTGTWRRDPDGLWSVDEFLISDIEELDDDALTDVVAQLRAIPSQWKDRPDSFGELDRIRKGEPPE